MLYRTFDGRELELHELDVARWRRRVAVRTPAECWPWLGRVGADGYGHVNVRRSGDVIGAAQAHRVAFAVWLGPVPAGLTVDHLCGVKLCQNPAHLRAVTTQENTAAYRDRVGRATDRLTCARGHDRELYGWRWRDGSWRCRECNRLANQRARDRARAT